ncbi:MAG TPA: nucleotide exchange factor GrpE [Mycobacteriales bacterium]|jgi:molecular chaperone GrpE
MSTSDRRRQPDEEPEQPRIVIRDKRRIDPVTGAVRDASGQPAGDDPAGRAGAESGDTAAWSAADAPHPDDAPELASLREQLTERTADLQRITAEYANYRKRVDRDRALVSEAATASVVGALLPLLDDVDRAAEHGDLTGAFKAVAEQLRATLGKLGLVDFGEVGDPFDPTRHEAVMHSTSPDVTEPSCVQVMRRGYQLGERLLRPAMVAVAEPEGPVVSDSVPEATADGPPDGADESDRPDQR